MADVERWAIITPHEPHWITVKFPVYPSDEAIATARRNITCIHGAVLPDPSGEEESFNAMIRPPTLPLPTRQRLRQIHGEDAQALPSVITQLDAFDRDMADLSLTQRRCIRRTILELGRIIQGKR